MHNYTTTDLYLASVLKALSTEEPDSIKLFSITGNSAKRNFNFSVDEVFLDEAINAYYDKRLALDAKTLIDTVKELKERAVSGR